MDVSAPIRISATQVEKGDQCLRKWGFQYLDGHKPEQGKGAALGQEVQDQQLDPYLSQGKPLDFSRPSGEIANGILPLLPPPGAPGMLLRQKFESMPSLSGKFVYVGEIDVWAPSSHIVPGLIHPAGHRALVLDIKTTKDLKYAKTESDLETDTQAQLYATWAMFTHGVDEVDLVWATVRSRSPHRAVRSHLRVGGRHVVEQFGIIDAKAQRLAQLKLQKPKAEELEPNPRMCDAYGGCPFRHMCNLSPAIHAAAINKEAVENMNSATNDFLAKLRASQPATSAPAPAPAVDPKTGLPPGVVPTPGGNPMLPRNDVPPAAPALPPWATAPVDPIHQQVRDIRSGHAPAPVAINPPESALPPAPPTGIAAANQPQPTSAATAEAPKKRGRPAKAAEEGKTIAQSEADRITADVALPDSMQLSALVSTMRALGIQELALGGGPVLQIKLFEAKS